jgi:hypothetical protein
MNLKVLIAAGVLALAAAGSANATVSFYSYGAGAPSLTLLTDFSGDTAGAAPASTAAYSWSGNGEILDPALSGGNGAEPAASPTTHDTGNYLSIVGGHSATLSLAKAVNEIEVYVGSLDDFNVIGFSDGEVYSGNDLAAFSGADNGNQSAANTNGVFDFKFATPVDIVTVASVGNSFEIASIATSAVPEPATWAMMLVGLFGLGAAMRAARRGRGASVSAA